MRRTFFDLIASSRKFFYRLGLGLGLALFLWQVWQGAQAVQQLTFELKQPFYLVAAFGLLLVAYALQMGAWAEIMRNLGSSINLFAAIQGYMVSFLPRYIPGTVWGYLSRDEWLKSQYGIPYSKSTLGSVMEVGFILLTASVISIAYYVWSTLPEPLGLALVIGLLLVPYPTWYSFKWIWRLFISKQSASIDDHIISSPNFWR
ncbi:MAG TPA: lysylphosphatidylglycerol synthase domain-containing protein, partial [Anaerolineae bacterium]|nr:lysylphosphatidylglycerol synthase domain-containing protein [Anaerolineae bacterium]